MSSREVIFGVFLIIFALNLPLVIAQYDNGVGIGATASYQVTQYNTTSTTTTTTTTTPATITSTSSTSSSTTTTPLIETTTSSETISTSSTTETVAESAPVSPITVGWIIALIIVIVIGELHWFKKSSRFGWK